MSSPTSPLCGRCLAASPLSTRWRAPRRKALLIGIASSGDVLLPGPHRDVQGTKQLLIDSYEFLENDIQLLLDDGVPGHLQPDRANILSAIQNLVHGARAGDRLFFLYCGHGIQVPARSPTEEFEEELDECIVPLDGEDNAIKDYELRAALVDPLPAGSSLVAVFDSCHSASLLALEHQRCNRVFVPWLSKGTRMTDECRRQMIRHLALPSMSPTSPVSVRRMPSQASARPKRPRPRRISIDVGLSPTCTQRDPLSPLMLSPRAVRGSPFGPKSPIADNIEDAPMSLAAIAAQKAGPADVALRRRAPPLKLWEGNKENLLSMPRSPKSPNGRSPLSPSSPPWLTFTDSLGSALPTASTILSPTAILYDSPVQAICQGWCRVDHALSPAPSDQAFVISLAACKDSELSWETEDCSMTQALIRVLSDDARPTLRNLLTRISHTLHGMALQRHSDCYAWRAYRKRNAIPSSGLGSFDTETFQHPQIASRKPLDMDMHWEL
ncbi:hypothetical protein HMN09_00385900 [Mycena chlorophos]|uniref:Peptidase C14 caspase domain-containing protein n=1 Tax=Mycena chlorophos TaxID=658473 RepID=A0A8H6WJ19_MYCCL|nr:hypothetical protein HMN09_00385900 [Mycena chlorophos]